MGGISLQESTVVEKGLVYDRRMMLVDEAGNFMTQRTNPKLALFKLSLTEGIVTIEHKKKHTSYSLPFGSHQQTIENVTIWADLVKAYEVSQASSAWFSDQLGMTCKLVFFPEENSRQVDKAYTNGDEQVSLADGYPYLIIGQAALDDLNNRLKEPLPMNRFRPNFVFTGGAPYEEDSWKHFSIGNNRFIGVKNCIRCALPTVNQDTGEKGIEPLYTLSTYRKQGSKVLFGQNVLAVDHGQVAVGDVITFDP